MIYKNQNISDILQSVADIFSENAISVNMRLRKKMWFAQIRNDDVYASPTQIFDYSDLRANIGWRWGESIHRRPPPQDQNTVTMPALRTAPWRNK